MQLLCESILTTLMQPYTKVLLIIEKSYIEFQDEIRKETGKDDVVLESLPPQKCGCPLLFGVNLD